VEAGSRFRAGAGLQLTQVKQFSLNKKENKNNDNSTLKTID
jgi:hypothetical protein